MSDAQLIDRMTALTMQIADRATQAAEQDPTTAPAIIDLAMSAATGLEAGRRVLLAYGDTANAVFMIEAAQRALNILCSLLQANRVLS